MTVHPPIVSPFTHSDTVTITIRDLADNSTVVNAAACVEIGSTGHFKYVPSLVIDSRSYLFVMTNGAVAMDRIGILEQIIPGSLAAADVSGNLPAVLAVTPPTKEEIITEIDDHSTRLKAIQDKTDLVSWTDIEFLISALGGSRTIASNQLILFAADGITEVARFDLFDESGQPSEINVYRRVRVL